MNNIRGRLFVCKAWLCLAAISAVEFASVAFTAVRSKHFISKTPAIWLSAPLKAGFSAKRVARLYPAFVEIETLASF